MIGQPLVSVIMPLYNTEEYVTEAIDSMLLQTYTEWELIVIDDHSSDDSVKIVESFSDQRITLLKNEANLGPAKTRNKGMRKAKGRYIAFLDSDDTLHPDRLRIQIDFLESHKDIQACGCAYSYFGVLSHTPNQENIDNEALKSLFCFAPGFHVPTLVFDRVLLDKYEVFLWDSAEKLCEDFDFCIRAIEHISFYVMSDCLYNYRQHSAQLTTSDERCKRLTAMLASNYLGKKLDCFSSQAEQNFYIEIASEDQLGDSPKFANMTTDLCNKILSTNRDKKIFKNEILEGGVSLRWYRALKPALQSKNAPLGNTVNTAMFRALSKQKKLGFILKYLAGFLHIKNHS